jgi:hypothetical protein
VVLAGKGFQLKSCHHAIVRNLMFGRGREHDVDGIQIKPGWPDPPTSMMRAAGGGPPKKMTLCRMAAGANCQGLLTIARLHRSVAQRIASGWKVFSYQYCTAFVCVQSQGNLTFVA